MNSLCTILYGGKVAGSCRIADLTNAEAKSTSMFYLTQSLVKICSSAIQEFSSSIEMIGHHVR